MLFLKKLYYFCLEHLEPILDSFSSRVCFFCRQKLGSLICQDCLIEELSLKKKSIDYKMLDCFFLDSDQVFHPKIFYIFNFFKKTSYLIKKAKYTRPYFAKFFAELLSESILKKLNSIFNDDLSESFINDFPTAVEKINIYISYTPMHRLKEIDRSFNFAKLVARYVFLKINKSLDENNEVLFQSSSGLKVHTLGEVIFLQDYFQRCRNTKPLFNLGQESRIKELENSFAINTNENIKKEGLNILLIIDDICTSGATMMELMRLSRLEAVFEDQIGLSIYGRNLK